MTQPWALRENDAAVTQFPDMTEHRRLIQLTSSRRQTEICDILICTIDQQFLVAGEESRP